MKKNILLVAFMLFSIIASAQITAWEDDFNDGEAADWTLLDVDGNTSNWSARKNQLLDPNTGEFLNGPLDVLFTTSTDYSTGSYYPNRENNWAITPAQDLSFYTGTVEFKINAQITEFGGGSENLLVYVSHSPDMDSLLATEPVTVQVRARERDQGEEFHEVAVDISQYAGAGQAAIYVAIVKSNGPQFSGIEIDDVKITASAIAAIDGVTKTVTKIKQNPVTETLQLQLSNNVNADALSVGIYNVSGMLVKETKYMDTGIAVSDLAGGMYFVILNDGKTKEQLKFIKK